LIYDVIYPLLARPLPILKRRRSNQPSEWGLFGFGARQ
jgi:hypothetical protein